MIFKVTSNTNHSGFRDFLCAGPQWPAQGIGHPGQRWGFVCPGVTVQLAVHWSMQCLPGLLLVGVWKDKGCCSCKIIHNPSRLSIVAAQGW